MKKIRVRFAPSPTGQLHIGNFRTALFNWLFARHNNGTFLVRIEDTDPERSQPRYTESILKTLSWAEITADEEILVQSERLGEYKKVLDRLISEKKAYRCYCTQEEIRTRAGSDLFVKYDGKCRDYSGESDKPFVIRFKVPDVKEVAFDDLIRGRVVVERDQLDDFIIARSDGWPMYNFVVVVDDNQMRITHIIRGEDHISNTPKQILLYQACGFDVPEFAHLPLILGPSGDRLSKRDAATSVLEYKQEGYLPDAFINYLARLGWSHGDQEIFSRRELVDYFTLKAVGKKGSIFDLAKLQWVNSVFLKETPAKELITYIDQELGIDLHKKFSDWDEQQIADAMQLYQGRVTTVSHLIEELHLLYQGPLEYNQSDYEKWITSDVPAQLERVTTLIEHHDLARGCLDMLKGLAKELGIKIVQLMQPVRLALIGKSSGPGVCELMKVIGKKESIKRLHALHSTIKRMSP